MNKEIKTVSDYQEMKCSDCQEDTGAWFEPSGAPHYHSYYCEECKNSREIEEVKSNE